MKERIKDKIEEIESYLEELSEILPSSLEKYEGDLKTKAACERYAEKIIEAVTDLAFLLIKEKGLSLPEEDLQAFEILTESKIISQELADKLQDAKRMRNILAHKYGEINDEIVFNALKDEIEKDIKNFIKYTKMNTLEDKNKRGEADINKTKKSKKDFFGAFKGMGPFTKEDELDTELE